MGDILTAVLIVIVVLAVGASLFEEWRIRSLQTRTAEERAVAVAAAVADAVKAANDAFQAQLDNRRPTAWIQSVLRKRIVVHTNNDQSIEGSLVETMDDGFVLRAAQLLNDEGSPTSMAGEVFIPRGNVAFAQLDE